jgi:hypothetical protein
MYKKTLIIPIMVLALAGSALASGSAPTRPPRPPSNFFAPAGEKLDNNRYALGKAVFTGKSPQTANPSAAKKQRTQLAHLAQVSGKQGASLPSLAGKLSNEQMDALDYYVSKRFGAH